VRFPFKPEFFQVSSFQPLRLKHLHCDDLHIILSSSAVQIYEFHIFMFIYSPSTGCRRWRINERYWSGLDVSPCRSTFPFLVLLLSYIKPFLVR